jgi:hypothetical protein
VAEVVVLGQRPFRGADGHLMADAMQNILRLPTSASFAVRQLIKALVKLASETISALIIILLSLDPLPAALPAI